MGTKISGKQIGATNVEIENGKVTIGGGSKPQALNVNGNIYTTGIITWFNGDMVIGESSGYTMDLKTYNATDGLAVRVAINKDKVKLVNCDTIELPSTGKVVIGDPETDGSWRITIVSDNLVFQRRESGSWVDKGSFSA